MNRIILIGNGFDLAHNMRTSFCNFLDYYWEKTIDEIIECKKARKYENENIIVPAIPPFINGTTTYDKLVNDLENYDTKIIFKNRFLKVITERSYIENWVDIENEYYLLLKKSYKDSKNGYNVEELNADFDKIKKELENYIRIVESNFELTDKELRWKIGYKIFSKFNLRDFTEASKNERIKVEYSRIKSWVEGIEENKIELSEVDREDISLVSRLTNTDHIKTLKSMLLSESAINYFDLEPTNILFLNFNYTQTQKYYSNIPPFDNFGLENIPVVDTIHIHGSVNSSNKNPIIFGFGDEKDEEYKSLEKLDNSYLEHIKSIKYLEAENYKKLLQYINSEKYQIFILGHSCGLSDRTLLSTLFEHQNCVSIKPYYYEKSQTEDNYTDISMNITRNFSNKASLRDKVANKKFCVPLLNA